MPAALRLIAQGGPSTSLGTVSDSRTVSEVEPEAGGTIMTFRSPIFRKLFIGAVSVIAVTLAGLDFYLTRYTTRREVDGVRQRLESDARIPAGELPKISPQQLEGWSKAAGDEARSRVTVIDPAGGQAPL